MQNDDRMELQKVRDFGDVIGDTFRILRHGIKPLGRSMIVIIGPFVAALSIITTLFNEEAAPFWNRFFLSALTNIGKTQEIPAEFYNNIFGVKYVLMLVLAAAVSVLMQCVVYEFISLYNEKNYRDISVRDIVQLTKKDFVMLLLTNSYLGLFSIAGIVFLILIGFINPIIMTLSVILIFGLGVYFIITLSLVPVIRINERTGFFQSFKRSLVLMYGSWWKTFGVMIVLFLIIMVISFGLSLPNTIFTFFITFSDIKIASNPGLRAIAVLLNAVQLIVYFFNAIPLIAVSFLYYNAVEKKEGRGLMKKVDEIGS